MKTDDDVLKRIVKEKRVRWESRRYPQRGDPKPPSASLHRLTTEGYIEVESHNITVWKYGPRDSYATINWQAQLAANVAILETMDEPCLRNRTEIWAIPTARGIQHAKDLGLLD